MSVMTTTNAAYLVRQQVWSEKLKTGFDEELLAIKYVEFLDDFPDGEEFNIPSIGQMEVQDYEEGQQIKYTAVDTGNYKFRISAYKSSAFAITKKQLQDSFYTEKLISTMDHKMLRVISESMEADVLSVGVDEQTAGDANSINGNAHRYIADGANQELTPKDFAKARLALQTAGVPLTNLTAIIDASAEYSLSTMTSLVNVSNNPKWEGIVAEGMSTGISFYGNIYGFDVYVSNFLKAGISETIGGSSVTNGVANLFFSAATDATPFIGAVRQAPEIESEYNKDKQQEEHVVTSRYGFGLYREESLVVGISSKDVA